MSIGIWVPLRLDTIPKVVAQINEFMEAFRCLSGAVPPPNQVAATERRIQQMLRSAQVRLEVLVDFTEAHPSEHRVERLKAPIKALRQLLAQEGVDSEGQHPSPPPPPESPVEPMSKEHVEKTVVPTLQITQPQVEIKRCQSQLVMQRERKDASNSGLNVSFSVDEGDVSASDVRQQSEEASRNNDLYVQQLRTREEALRNKLRFATEREHNMLKSIFDLEQENLRLERSLVEMSESRERMKGIVEEQIHTISLLTRVSGLLHLEKGRTLQRRIAQGTVFWCASLVALSYLAVTWGAPLFAMYSALRETFQFALPDWTVLILDCVAVAMTMSVAHEWVAFAIHDFNYGALDWLLETIMDHTEESPPRHVRIPVPPASPTSPASPASPTSPDGQQSVGYGGLNATTPQSQVPQDYVFPDPTTMGS